MNIQKIMFDKVLRDLMNESNLNISQLATKTGIPRTTINNWLNQQRNPKIEYLQTLSKFFNCTIDYLTGIENELGNKI